MYLFLLVLELTLMSAIWSKIRVVPACMEQGWGIENLQLSLIRCNIGPMVL